MHHFWQAQRQQRVGLQAAVKECLSWWKCFPKLWKKAGCLWSCSEAVVKIVVRLGLLKMLIFAHLDCLALPERLSWHFSLFSTCNNLVTQTRKITPRLLMWWVLDRPHAQFHFRSQRLQVFFTKSSGASDPEKGTWIIHHAMNFSGVFPSGFFFMLTAAIGSWWRIFFFPFTLCETWKWLCSRKKNQRGEIAILTLVPLRTRFKI